MTAAAELAKAVASAVADAGLGVRCPTERAALIELDRQIFGWERKRHRVYKHVSTLFDFFTQSLD